MSARDFASLTHITFGEPVRWWHYTDSFATALCIDKRRRRTVKVSAVHNGHQCYWHTPPGSVPLYGLAPLAARPDAPVLVVQSEEAADAARELFPDHVGMTWAGGPNAVNQADTAPLGRRDVILWHDNDPASETAMARFAVRLRGFARSVTIVDVPRNWPQKWHLARDLPSDVTVAMLRRMLPAVASMEPVPRQAQEADEGEAASCALVASETTEEEPVQHDAATSGVGGDEDSVALHTLSAHQAMPEAETRVPALEAENERSTDAPFDVERSMSDRAPPGTLMAMPRQDEECGRNGAVPLPDRASQQTPENEPPAFPIDILPPLWRDWCRDSARIAGAPVDYAALSLLTATASLIGGTRRVSPVPAWREPCVLWTALVGAPSSGKSRGMQAALDLMRDLQSALGTTGEEAQRRHAVVREVARVQARLWRQDVRNMVIAGAAPDPLPDAAVEPPLPRRLLLDTPRPRVIADAVRGHRHGILLASGGLDAWLGRTARGADQRLWKSAWSGAPWTITRAHQPPVDVPAAVSILGTLRAAALPSGADEGILARCLFVCPPPVLLRPLSPMEAGPCPDACAALARLRDMPAAVRDVPLASGALVLFEAFRRALDDAAAERDGREAAWWHKGAAAVLRVAGVLSFLAWSSMPADAPEPAHVSADVIRTATRLWQDYLWPHARAVFGTSRGEALQRHVATVRRWLVAEQPAEVSREEIRREVLSQAVDAAGADAIIATLVAGGWLQPVDRVAARPGRPARRWRVMIPPQRSWGGAPKGRRGGDEVFETDTPRLVPLRPSATSPTAWGREGVSAISATDSESAIALHRHPERSEGSPVPAISATTSESPMGLPAGRETGLQGPGLTPARDRLHDPAAPPQPAPETPFMPVINRIADFHDEMTAWRHDIHMHPETAFEEFRTADIVAKKLESFGIEVHRGLAKTGIVGVLRAGNGTRAIGLRADMDALDVHETNTFAHASTLHGKMHACGHDGHTCMLLGAAKHLAETRNFDGTVYFIFQPAEENEGGGRVMVEEGLFDKFPCADVYGMHNIPGMPVGKFAIRSGPMMAAYDVFEVIIEGKGAHGAMPHHGIDPVVVASHIVTALQSIVARNVDPMDTAVVSTTQIHSGDTWNVIPQSAMLRGTVRTFKAHVQDFIEKRIEEIARNVSAAFGASITFRYERRYPATVNTEAETENAARAAAALVGDGNVNRNPTPAMGSEDFAWMLRARPGAYIWIGNGDGEGSCMVHNPGYDFNDAVLPLGASYWVTLVEQQLARQQPVRQAAE